MLKLNIKCNDQPGVVNTSLGYREVLMVEELQNSLEIAFRFDVSAMKGEKVSTFRQEKKQCPYIKFVQG